MSNDMGNYFGKIVSTRILTLCIMVITLSGCAHKRLIDDGEQFAQSGRMEQAVKSYQKALEIKPNDRNTQQKLATAQQALDLWLDDIHQAADDAKQQGLSGRALLLYSKVAQLRRDNIALNAYKALYQQLLTQARYHLNASGPTQFGEQFAARMADIVIVNSLNTTIDTNADNYFDLNASLTTPSFNTRSTIKEVTQSYVSGTETVANPDFHRLQDDIAAKRDQLHHYQSDYDNKLVDADHAQHALIAVEKDLEIARLRYNQAAPRDTNYWRNEINRLSHIASDKRAHYDHIRSDLDAINHHIVSTRSDLNHALNELSYINPTVEQDVYSDHHYDVEQITRTANGKLTVTFSGNGQFANSNLTRSKTITASDTDEAHQAQPVLRLKVNDVNLQSDQQIARQYYANGKEQARIAIKQHLNDYRKHLRHQANNVAGVDQQLEAAVIYGLSGSDGVDNPTARDMQRKLQQEFGVTGEFEINQLLYLFD